MNKPQNTDKCATCEHTFSMHYETYDGKKKGCIYSVDDQRDPYDCDCKGFTVAWSFSSGDGWSPHPNMPGVRGLTVDDR